MTVAEYKKGLLDELNKQRNMDRSKIFGEEELKLIDKVYGLVVQTIELSNDDCENDMAGMANSQPKTDEWIPCNSGKMPHAGATVLIQLPESKGGITLVNGISVDISFVRSINNEWVSSCGVYPFEDVIAWQPLKAFKPQSNKC